MIGRAARRLTVNALCVQPQGKLQRNYFTNSANKHQLNVLRASHWKVWEIQGMERDFGRKDCDIFILVTEGNER